MVELHDRLGPVAERVRPSPAACPAASAGAEAQEALLALGFTGDEIGWAFADAPDGLATAELVRYALGKLRRG